MNGVSTTLAALPVWLIHQRNVAILSLFYRCYLGKSSYLHLKLLTWDLNIIFMLCLLNTLIDCMITFHQSELL